MSSSRLESLNESFYRRFVMGVEPMAMPTFSFQKKTDFWRPNFVFAFGNKLDLLNFPYDRPVAATCTARPAPHATTAAPSAHVLQSSHPVLGS